MTVTTCIFDAYGTLFDVSAAARAAASETGREAFGAHWQEVARTWRDKQLQYTWLRAVTGRHKDFWQLTQDGLDYALESVGLDGDAELRERLLALYWELEAFPEVPESLSELQQAGKRCAILSNGSPEMLKGAVESAGLGGLLDDVLSVEAVGVFKPDARVYDLVGDRYGCARDEVLFVSSNGWDVCSAAAYGFATAWVNRAAAPLDRLDAAPDHILPDLSGLPEILR
ncbi:2-haloacid dehalogenase [Tranquillimonas rosea]|uniref:(S)-2-haloacid dehalogenase n=1 Tax=Tranquillimonas rosea TaxID=641238 RepID=A0A1H9X8D4_9RHOB|nr:haloacid dehalogenase type II [Tranquillimonas rosea]SES42331.1 2-haloacid dehalogenase [Tranquillimonas rosea]